MNSFFKFMSSPKGRLVQGVLGGALIFGGLAAMSSGLGGLIIFVGLVALAAGVFDVCVPAPIFNLPFEGPKLRKELLRRQLRRPQARTH